MPEMFRDPKYTAEDIRAWQKRKAEEDRAEPNGADDYGAAKRAHAHDSDDPRTDVPPVGEEPRANGKDGGIRIKTSAEFVGSLRKPDYIVDGLLQRGFLYSFTGQTGALKTTILLRILAHTAEGKPICGHEVERGRCLMLVGENPDDVKARWIALAEQAGFDDTDIDVHFIEGVFDIGAALPIISAKVDQLGGVSMVGVDTSPAYFQGDDENSNAQLGNHARVLRKLTELPGRPCVVATCHPAKGTKDADNLLPRGGGAYLCEVDGNLTSEKSDQIATVHWTGKFRGPEFAPIYFEQVTAFSPRLVTAKGREMPTVFVRPLSDDESDAKTDEIKAEKRQVLKALSDNPGMSLAAIATKLGWLMKTGEPYKVKVQRRLTAMVKDKLVRKDKIDDTYSLTNEGQNAVEK